MFLTRRVGLKPAVTSEYQTSEDKVIRLVISLCGVFHYRGVVSRELFIAAGEDTGFLFSRFNNDFFQLS